MYSSVCDMVRQDSGPRADLSDEVKLTGTLLDSQAGFPCAVGRQDNADKAQ